MDTVNQTKMTLEVLNLDAGGVVKPVELDVLAATDEDVLGWSLRRVGQGMLTSFIFSKEAMSKKMILCPATSVQNSPSLHVVTLQCYKVP